MTKVAVIIPAAGKSERFGGSEKKTFAKLDGRPIFLRTLEHFVNREDVIQTILVLSASDMSMVKDKFGANLSFMGVKIVEGGDQRYDSVKAGLDAVSEDAELIAIHDAVRPCVMYGQINSVFEKAKQTGAAILASPLNGTIKKAGEGDVIDSTVPRENLYEAQTPQVFSRDLILGVYEEKPEGWETFTDDAQWVEAAGKPVTLVQSNAMNLKITRKEDVTLANAILKARPDDKPVKKLGAFEEAQW